MQPAIILPLTQYLLSTIPMFMVFAVTMFVATRIFNEEYLMGFRPLYRKLSEAVYLIMDKAHLNLSVLSMSLLLIPLAFMVQFASIVIAFNLSLTVALSIVFILSVITEEIAKSAAIVVLLQNRIVTSLWDVIKLSFMAGLGFLIGEKLLLFLALRVMSESIFTEALFSSGVFLLFPLMMHVATTSIVCLLTARFGLRFYPFAVLAGVVVHTLYNLYIIREAIF